MALVELRLLAREKGTATLEVAPGTTTDGLMDLAGVDRKRTLIVLVNGRYAEPGWELSDGDVVSVFPPVAGG